MGDCAGIGFKNCERRGGQNSLLIEGFKYGLSSCLFCGKNLREAERSTSANFHTEIITRVKQAGLILALIIDIEGDTQ